MIEDFGGLSKKIPIFAAFFMIVTLSSIGLPGTNGFVGEFLILLGTFKSNVIYAVFAATGIILAAVYMLWMYQRTMFGKITKPENENLKDLNLREKMILIPLVLVIFWIGLYPKPFFVKMEPSVKSLIENAKIKYEENKTTEVGFDINSQQLKQVRKVMSEWSAQACLRSGSFASALRADTLVK
jgi:NADH-quinone oxidoreductase subunit M